MGGGRRRKQELARRQNRRRRLLRLAAFVVVATVLIGAALYAFDGSDRKGTDDELPPLARAGSSVVTRRPPAPLVDEPEPVAYRIEYRVRYRSGTKNAERLVVRRPFESRVETFIGRGPSGEPDQVSESRFGVRATKSKDDDAQALAIEPGVPEGDIRVRAALAPAIDAKLLERRERRRVAGRECDVYRGGGSVTEEALRPPTPAEHTDVCIDAAGLLLESWNVVEGDALVQRVASKVEVLPDDHRIDFALPADPTAPSEGGGKVSPVAAGAAPEGPAWVLDAGPEGFAFVGRFAVVVGQAALVDPTRGGEAVAGLADVWTRGIDFVVVEQAGRLDKSDPFRYRDGTPRVDLSPTSATGEVLYGLIGGEVRTLLGEGRSLRAYGPVGPDVLTQVLRRVRAVQGTGLG